MKPNAILFKKGYFYFLFCLVIVTSLSLMKSYEIYTTKILTVECYVGGDKFLHFYFSVILGFSAMISNSRRFFHLFGFRVLLLVGVFCSDELIQQLFPSRKSSLSDFIVDCSGVICAVVIYQLINLVLSKRNLEI